jgi:hypothetical protein
VKCAPPSLTETIHEFVIFLGGTNPEPDNIFVFAPCNGAVMETDINRPDVALMGKAQGRMRKPEVRVYKKLAQRRKGAEKEGTEAGGRKEKTEVRCPREVTCA